MRDPSLMRLTLDQLRDLAKRQLASMEKSLRDAAEMDELYKDTLEAFHAKANELKKDSDGTPMRL